MPDLTHGQKSDVGHSRSENQDSLAAAGRQELGGLADGLFVVADGMGGRAGGEIASRVTADTVPEVVKEVLVEGRSDAKEDSLITALHEGISAANDSVWKQAHANSDLRGMGTTCVAALIRDGVAAI